MRFHRVRCSAHLCVPGLLSPSDLGIPCCKPRAATVGINRPPTLPPLFVCSSLRTHLSCSVPNPHATAPVCCLPGVMMGRLACQLLAAGLLALATAVTAQPSPSALDIREWTPAPCLLDVCCACDCSSMIGRCCAHTTLLLPRLLRSQCTRRERPHTSQRAREPLPGPQVQCSFAAHDHQAAVFRTGAACTGDRWVCAACRVAGTSCRTRPDHALARLQATSSLSQTPRRLHSACAGC